MAGCTRLKNFMDVFGIGVPGLAVIRVFALIFVGPDKSPEMAKRIGGWVREFRSMTGEATSIWRETLDVQDTIKGAVTDSTNMMRGVTSGVPYVPPAFRPETQITLDPAQPSAQTVTFAPATTTPTEDLSYPAPFVQQGKAPVVEPTEDLEYPAPFAQK